MSAPLDEAFAPTAPRKRASTVNDSEKMRTERSLSWLNAQPFTYAYKLHAGARSVGGHPDLDGCQEGRSIKIEMKKPGEEPTLRQMARLRRWAEVGAIAGWAEDVRHVQEIMARHRDPHYRNPLTGPGAPDMMPPRETEAAF